MKKVIVTSILILASTFIVKAQQDTLKSRDGDWGFVLNLTGLIDNISIGNVTDGNNNNSILAKHHLTNDRVLRLGLGLKSISDNWLLEDSITVVSSGNSVFEMSTLTKECLRSKTMSMQQSERLVH